MTREIIQTDSAPQAIGTYSQAVKTGTTVYLSGQIPLHPETMEMVDGDMAEQIRRVFDNLSAVANAAGGSLYDVVKLNVYLTDLGNFALVNEIMATYFRLPYPARAAVGVAAREGEIRRDADAFDAGEGSEPVCRLLVEPCRDRRVLTAIPVERHRHDPVRFEAEVDGAQLGEAPQHEARPDQQDERQRELDRDEEVAGAISLTSGRVRPSPVAQDRGEAGPGVAGHRDRAE
jgi:reactive intermediate/imine deaminase